MRIILFILIAILPGLAAAKTTEPSQPVKHVIFITLDGIRWQDMFYNKHWMPKLWHGYAKNAVIYGEPGSNREMRVAARIPYSLPSYQSMMAGVATSCMDNDCGRLKMQTFPEALVKKAGLKRSEVASISSWEVMDDAYESQLGTAFSNHGTRPMHDPDTFTTDDVMMKLNKQQVRNYPGDDTRWDKYTLAQALYYYKKYQPRFLWISFGDADDYAHEGNYKAYRKTFKLYDDAIDQVFMAMKKLHRDENTMVIITTDHGRGLGKDWLEHEPSMPSASQGFAFVFNGKLENGEKHGNIYRYSHLSIRPTIEKVFGLHNSVRKKG